MFIRHSTDLKDKEYIPIGQDRKEIIARVNDSYQLISNVCPHQKSLISTDKGKGSRTCPYHGWSFTINGDPIGNGKTSCKNNYSLPAKLLYEWNHLLFSNPIDCEKFADFSYLELVENRVDTVNGSSITIMDVFLDVDHIPIVHRGVYDQIGLTNVSKVNWTYYNWGSLQSVPRNNDYHEEFESTLLDEDKKTSYSAVWLAVYPGTMIEWQPGAVFITVCEKTKDNHTPVQVYKYRDTRYNNLNWTLNSQMWELSWEQDKAQVGLITEVNNDNLEEQKLHFRRYLNSY
jgi:phenylpropionate dioxygenase-like ring-hydroxylating dioxygenase large terminal subunit